MPKEKIDSYFQSPEFPWLSRAVGELRERIDSIYVWRVDPDFVGTWHLTTTTEEVTGIDDTTDIVKRTTVDDIRLLDASGIEVDRVNQRLCYKAPVVWWKPWTWFKYGNTPFFSYQRPVWFFNQLKETKSIRDWLIAKSLPPIYFVLHFTPSKEDAKKLTLVIRKVPKSSKESRTRMNLQTYIDFLIIQEDREKRLRLESLLAEVADEVAAVDAEPNSD